MFNIGPTELIVILLIALIVFGPRRLPEIGRTIGRSLREFRRASDELREELRFDLGEEPPRVGRPARPPARRAGAEQVAPAADDPPRPAGAEEPADRDS